MTNRKRTKTSKPIDVFTTFQVDGIEFSAFLPKMSGGEQVKLVNTIKDQWPEVFEGYQKKA